MVISFHVCCCFAGLVGLPLHRSDRGRGGTNVAGDQRGLVDLGPVVDRVGID
jgi:hypothetical protein